MTYQDFEGPKKKKKKVFPLRVVMCFWFTINFSTSWGLMLSASWLSSFRSAPWKDINRHVADSEAPQTAVQPFDVQFRLDCRQNTGSISIATSTNHRSLSRRPLPSLDLGRDVTAARRSHKSHLSLFLFYFMFCVFKWTIREFPKQTKATENADPFEKVSRRKAEKSLTQQEERGRPVWFSEAESQQHLGPVCFISCCRCCDRTQGVRERQKMYRRGAKKKKIKEIKNSDATRDF